ncbi:MAG: hypothetical protein HC890_05660 [Chloroflexaceae bacterium]|nr:hypothetical protein [Chloroflexaceae bacterium]
MSTRFSLAPMSPFLRNLTLLLWLLPPTVGVWAIAARELTAAVFFLLLIALYGAVWFWFRPSHFVVSHDYLEIVFPGRQRRISLESLFRVRSLTQETFNREFGWAIRIGVGGLWGGFGWLWTSRQGLIEFYISRLDEFVLIERLGGKSLLITPENPQQFVQAIQAAL